MEFFFQRRRPATAACQPPAVHSSKARRRSSVGLPSAALSERRRSSGAGPPSGPRRPSAGALVACGTKGRFFCSESPAGGGESSIQRQGGALGFKPRHACRPTAVCGHRGFLLRRHHASKVRSIKTHLLGPSMLLASLVQVSVAEAESGLVEAGSDEEDGSGEELQSPPGGGVHQRTSCQTVHTKPCPLLRPPRCLRRNSSHLAGVEGRYSRRRSSSVSWTSSISVGQPVSGRGGATDGSAPWSLQKSCSSPVGGADGTVFYDPYLDSWENFLSYVAHTHAHALALTFDLSLCICVCVCVEQPVCPTRVGCV